MAVIMSRGTINVIWPGLGVSIFIFSNISLGTPSQAATHKAARSLDSFLPSLRFGSCCQQYQGSGSSFKMYCSVECFSKAHSISLNCIQCGKNFDTGLSDYNARLRNRKIKGFFCSKECHGKWVAEKYGFQKGQTKIGGRKAHIDSGKVVELYKTKTAKDIAIEMNISQSYIYQIIAKKLKKK